VTQLFHAIWVALDGSTIELSEENGYTILYGLSGLDAPPVELNTAPRTAGDGSLLVKRRTNDRFIVLPLRVRTETQVRSTIAMLADKFRGPGQFRFSENGSTFRTLRDVYYETGLEGDESSDASYPGVWRKVVVSLRALDPWWYGAAEARTMSLGAETAFDAVLGFDDPVTPFDGGTTTTFQVGGHADSYPVWTFAGPFTALTVVVAGSESMELASALADGSTITVDTRPGSRGPSLNGGAVDWSILTAASRLPTFAPGSTSVAVGAAGDDAGSSVSVTYEPRWLTP